MSRYELCKDDLELIDEALLAAARGREAQARYISPRFKAYQFRNLAEEFRKAYTAWIDDGN